MMKREQIEDQLQVAFEARAEAEQGVREVERGTPEHFNAVVAVCELDSQILLLRCKLD